MATTFLATEFFNYVENLWQLDTLPYSSKKLVTRSQSNEEAMNLLEAKTTTVKVEGAHIYATLLLHVSNMLTLTAQPEALLPSLHGTEKHLSRDPVKAEAYQVEIMKLERGGYTTRVSQKQAITSKESWFIPYHMVI